MVVYSVILFAAAAALIVCSVLIYRGRISLIHAHHRTRVKDKAGYGRAMGKALAVMSLPLIAAGVLAFFTASAALTLVLVGGLALSCIPLVLVQRKYNGGLF